MPKSFNEVLATGQGYIDRSPLRVLMELQAAIGYTGGVGYTIVLGDNADAYMYKRLTECILFNTGGDTHVPKP